MDALQPQRAPSSPSTAVPLASIDPQHFLHNAIFASVPTCDFTHHIVEKFRDGVDERPDPLAVGLRVDGTARCSDGRTSRGLQGVNLEEMKCPKKMFWGAALWEDVFFQEHASRRLTASRRTTSTPYRNTPRARQTFTRLSSTSMACSPR